uniref:Uncharacterized protein n=1 Tax=Macaca fascicularis TaxID=9541 RepID=A0A7N9CZK1_MACFA
MRTRTGCRHCVPSSGMCLSTTSPSQEPRHHDLLPEQEVPHFARGVPAAAAAEQGLPLHHAAPVVLKWSVTQVGSDGAAGRRGAVPGPADRSHAGGLGEEPALRPHGVHDGPGGGHTHGNLGVAGRHQREVVILACRNPEGAGEDLQYLVACIKNILGDMLCPRGELPAFAAAVVPRTAGHRLLRGRELPGPALRAVARNPLLVGKHGKDRGPHPLPGRP